MERGAVISLMIPDPYGLQTEDGVAKPWGSLRYLGGPGGLI